MKGSIRKKADYKNKINSIEYFYDRIAISKTT
jgi:hypothetical protein